MAVFTGKPYPNTVTATANKTRVLAINSNSLDSLLEADPTVARKLLAIMSERNS